MASCLLINLIIFLFSFKILNAAPVDSVTTSCVEVTEAVTNTINNENSTESIITTTELIKDNDYEGVVFPDSLADINKEYLNIYNHYMNTRCFDRKTATGVIDQHLNIPIGGTFTFYPPSFGYGGACGIDNNVAAFSAAVSKDLFDNNAKWNSCKNGGQVRNDKVCISKCVKIEYKNKKLIIPITNECPTCKISEVDLSKTAFHMLESNFNVGKGTGARLTFINC